MAGVMATGPEMTAVLRISRGRLAMGPGEVKRSSRRKSPRDYRRSRHGAVPKMALGAQRGAGIVAIRAPSLDAIFGTAPCRSPTGCGDRCLAGVVPSRRFRYRSSPERRISSRRIVRAPRDSCSAARADSTRVRIPPSPVRSGTCASGR